MSIFERNLNRWIGANVLSDGGRVNSLLLPLFFLQCLPYGAGQPGNPSPYMEARPHIPLLVLAMLMLSLIVSMVACCMCYKFCGIFPPATADDVEPEGRGGWLRSTHGLGLDADIIDSFPSFLYSEVKGLKIGKGGVECAVCLNEFEDREILRLMPPCSHVFHADCIDVWLSSRPTCPVCRANLYPKPGERIPYPFIDPSTNPDTPDPPRSRSTGLSSWRITEMLFPRSHSTGHSLVQPGENLDRFTLQLPEEVRRQLIRLNRTRSHGPLPQARSSRRGYRSGSVGSGFPYGRQNNRRAVSLSFSFSFQAASARSSPGRNDLGSAPSKGPSRSIKSPFHKTFQSKDEDSSEQPFARLRSDS